MANVDLTGIGTPNADTALTIAIAATLTQVPDFLGSASADLTFQGAGATPIKGQSLEASSQALSAPPATPA